MSRRLSREEKGKGACFDSHEAPRTARIKVSLPESTELDSKFSLTLIGRVTNPSTQRIWPLIAFFTELWKSDVRPVGADLGNGLFHFQFEREADLLQVLEKRPYHYSRWMVIVQRWEPTISKSFPALIPFWIKVQGIPIHLWKESTIKSIGEDIGVYEKAEITPVSVRMRVQVNGLLPLIKSTVIEYSNGGEVVATLSYERLEKHCAKCFRLDHELKDCLEAKHQNKARLASMEPTLSKEANASQPISSAQNSYKSYEREPQQDRAFRFSASNLSVTHERRSTRETKENPPRRPYKALSREWEERGSQRRSTQARDRLCNLEDRHSRPPRDHRSHRYIAPQGRSYYREVARKLEINKDAGSTASKALSENCERGTPQQNCRTPLPQEVLQEAIGEVREAMMQYTKHANPTENRAREERLRQAEEQGEIEETARSMVKSALEIEADKQRFEQENATPARLPVMQRLGSPGSLQGSERQTHHSTSQDRIPATQRLVPVILGQEHSNSRGKNREVERPPTSLERIPAAMRLGENTAPTLTMEAGEAPCKEKRKPGRPPGRKSTQNSPRLTASASSRIRKVSQKPSPIRRKQVSEKKTTKPSSKAGTSRGKGMREVSATSSENRPICNMIPATSKKRMDFRGPSTLGP